MPQVPMGELADNGHTGGNTDTWPFLTQHASQVLDYEAHIEAALDAGVNGFALLTFPDPAMFTAAENVFRRTGRRIYLAPEWADLGADPQKAAQRIADWALKNKDNPFLFRLRGKQLHFTYNEGKWSTGPGLGQARELITNLTRNEPGADVALVATIMPWDKALLNRPDLNYGPWPAFQPVQPGPGNWFESSLWDGATDLNMGIRPREDVLQAMLERVKPVQDRFLLVPSFSPGYDSSNRRRQAIHTKIQGIRCLRDGLRTFVQSGFKHLTLSTWNDITETLTLPSTRSVWGYSSVIRYYHQLAQDGTSPFAKPKIVAAYDQEVLYGDQLYVQTLALPEKDAVPTEYRTSVSLQDPAGQEVATLSGFARSGGEGQDALAEMRLDTTALAGREDCLTPVITVWRQDPTTGARQTLYSQLRLAPIRLRYNKAAYYTPTSIDLDRVAAGVELKLEAQGSVPGGAKTFTVAAGAPFQLRATANGPEALNRLSLAESCLSLGAYRADDAAGALPAGQQRAFVRVMLPADARATLAVEGGTIQESYLRHWDVNKVIQTYNGSTAPAQGNRAFRIVAPPTATITLTAEGGTTRLVRTTLAALRQKPGRAVLPGGPVLVQVTTDGTDANRHYPLPATGSYVRTLSLTEPGDARRYYHLWALTQSGKIAYSRPVAVERATPAGAPGAPAANGSGETVVAPFIRTGGTFDDFVNQHLAQPANPFTAADIVTVQLPTAQIPYAKLDMDEGSGERLNDGGTAQQLGSARTRATWVPNGWRGSALRLEGTPIELRSKTMPHGAATLSFRLQPVTPAAEVTLFKDNGWEVRLLKDGKVAASRTAENKPVDLVSTATLQPGWNHLAVVYDLRSLKIYLNGKLSAERAGAPSYLRTHSVATIGPGGDAHKANPSPLLLDQVEIIGTSLDAAAIERLYRQGSWR